MKIQSSGDTTVPPPAEYYTGKFEHMFAWVRRHHRVLVDAQLERWMRRFDALPAGARHLFVRLLMRRGPDFRIDLIAYPGVDDVPRAALALAYGGFGSLVADAATRLGMLRVPELRRLAARRGLAVGRLRREELLGVLLGEEALPGAHELPLVLRLMPGDEVDCLRLLYFGSLRQDLSAFVLEDIGTLRWPAPPLEPRLPFPSAGAVRRALAVHRLADVVSELHHGPAALRDAVDGGTLDALSTALATPSPCAHTEERRTRAQLRLAACHQARGRPAAELRALRLALHPPARERACRLLARRGRLQAAERLRRAMARAPEDVEEARFAARFDVRRGRCTPRRRRGSVQFRRLNLPRGAPGVRVEARVAELFTAAGNRALHMENRLPGMLFLLGFWDLIFAPLPGAFVQPFQAGPMDLHDGRFRTRRAAAVEARLAAIAAERYGIEDFLAVLAREAGTVNAFWGWQERASAEALLRSLPPALRAGICDLVASEPRRARSGFPDLTIGNGAGNCAFFEIKGPGDQLREAQGRWLEDLVRLGARAEVIEVRWR